MRQGVTSRQPIHLSYSAMSIHFFASEVQSLKSKILSTRLNRLQNTSFSAKV